MATTAKPRKPKSKTQALNTASRMLAKQERMLKPKKK